MNHFNDNLMQYPLPGRLSMLLRQSDSVAQTLARAGKPAPRSITLFPMHFDAIDTLVRLYSDGKFTARSVQWNGRPLSRLAVAETQAA